MHFQLLFQLLGVLEAQSFTGSQDHHRQRVFLVHYVNICLRAQCWD